MATSQTKRKSQYNGVYPLAGNKWGARITERGKMRHIGTFVNERDAAKAFDLVCALYSRVLSQYNFPDEPINEQALHKMAMHFKAKDWLTQEDVERIARRYKATKSIAATVTLVDKVEKQEGSK